MINKTLFFLYILYCFEVGLFLIIFPWMNLWDDNSVLAMYPSLRYFVLNNFFRGAVSGLGLTNILLGAWEVAHFNQYFGKA